MEGNAEQKTSDLKGSGRLREAEQVVVTITKEEYDKLMEVSRLAVEFGKLGLVPVFAKQVMGDLTPKEIVAQINQRAMILVNADLRTEQTTVDEYTRAIVPLTMQLIFLSHQIGIDLVSAINSQMVMERAMLEVQRQPLSDPGDAAIHAVE